MKPPRLPPRIDRLLVPDVGMDGRELMLSLWLVPEGTRVLEGDRVVELVCGAATIDLESPVCGRLVRQLVGEDFPVSAGTAIAEFLSADEV
ncbi:MAG: lipoyl domain-containing protein [Planctomycetia bacterium]|nr:lipoyl domain-containing protein [Planctomycetia bacterium]RLT05386.1 MAG: biotin attachment protein [Planctomycetota bacterium]